MEEWRKDGVVNSPSKEMRQTAEKSRMQKAEYSHHETAGRKDDDGEEEKAEEEEAKEEADEEEEEEEELCRWILEQSNIEVWEGKGVCYTCGRPGH